MSFTKSFEYRGFQIAKTSFNWRVKEAGTEYGIVESVSEGREMVDKIISEREERFKERRKPTKAEEALEDVLQ